MGYVFSGNDQLTGGSGDDKLYGWNGNDSITGSSGNDIIDGGNGTDYAYFSDKYGDCLITFNGDPS
jgi:Ca2+-binding RTX toxin-like protein